MSSFAAPQRSGRYLICTLSLSFVLLICAKGATAKIEFVRHEIDTGIAEYQTVLTGNLLGSNHADLAIVNVGRDRARWAHVYSLGEGGWTEATSAPLRSRVLFVDVANVGGSECLLLYETGNLGCLDPESGAVRALATARLGVQPSEMVRFPMWTFRGTSMEIR